MQEQSLTPGGVFLSYAREDTEAARRIADALRAFGVDAWLDQSELRGGDSWDAKIKKQIRECRLFVPVVSAATQARGEGYFRREWKLAVERTHDMAAGVPFLLPVVIDDTLESEALVPDELMRVQWSRLARGVPTPEFVEQVKRLLDRKTVAGVADPGSVSTRSTFAEASANRPGSTTPATAKKKAVPAWTWGAITAVVVGIVTALSVSHKSGPNPVAPPAAAVVDAPKAAATPAVLPKISEKSIAVLPFANMSEDKDNTFFADGMHEDILTNLALVRDLHVVSRTSVMEYRNTTKKIREIAQELGVAYILEGSVRREGKKVRVTGQLIRASTDEHVWAKNYDRDLTDIFAIQSELSQAIASALSAVLSPEEKQLLDRRPTENLAAYDAYVKARELRLRNTPTDEDVRGFAEATRLDPKFAQAWAQLASAISQSYFNDFGHSAGNLARAKQAIENAVRLAPDDPEVIECLGDYYYYGYRDYDRAIEQYQRLAVLRPNDAAVFGSLGFIHRRQGRWNEALTELRRAVELEPRNLRYGHTFVQLTLGLNRYEEAAAAQARIVAFFPDSLLDATQVAVIPFLATGSTLEGTAVVERLKTLERDNPLAIYLHKQWVSSVGQWDESIQLGQQQKYYDDFGEAHWTQDTSAAFMLWAHGDQAAARALAAHAVAEGKAELEQRPSATSWSILSAAYTLLGEKTEALRCAQAAKDLIPESKDAVSGPPMSLNYAQVLAWVGEKDRALAELARLLRTPFGENIYSAKYGVNWLPLHGDPRFEKLVNDPANNAPLP